MSARQSAHRYDAKLLLPVRSAPRVKVGKNGAHQVLEPILEGTDRPDEFRARFLAAFGTSNETVAEALLQQLLNGLHAEPGKPVDSAAANLALGLMHEIGPKDVVEGMLACQLIVVHVASMDAARRALHVEQSAAGRAVYLSLARKLMALFAMQMDALNRNRGKATTQKIVIERVYVAPGAQAIVGAVENGGRGDG